MRGGRRVRLLERRSGETGMMRGWLINRTGRGYHRADWNWIPTGIGRAEDVCQ